MISVDIRRETTAGDLRQRPGIFLSIQRNAMIFLYYLFAFLRALRLFLVSQQVQELAL
jgi:hypothetical protein